jgi:hypothetical protein
MSVPALASLPQQFRQADLQGKAHNQQGRCRLDTPLLRTDPDNRKALPNQTEKRGLAGPRGRF